MKTWQWALVALIVPGGCVLLALHLHRQYRWQQMFSDRLPRLRQLMDS